MKQTIQTILLAGLLAVLGGGSARAALYTFFFADEGAIYQSPGFFSAAHTLSGLGESSITDLQLILTFANSVSLGQTPTILGRLTLGNNQDSPYASLKPAFTGYSGPNPFYEVTFSGVGSEFYPCNPNNTWGLVLWDTGTGSSLNGLVGWTLNITAVPEPANVALAAFAGLIGVVFVGKRLVRRAGAFRQRAAKLAVENLSPKAR
jgi:hypothetical protein